MKSKSDRRREGELPIIPEDVVILIISRLPLRALHRLKAVSKSWSSLIKEVRRPPPLFLGLFYDICGGEPHGVKSRTFRYVASNNSTIDPSLSFLPRAHRKGCPLKLTVIDCCNGLLLCRSGLNSRTSFVCNPLTKSWTQVDHVGQVARLDFDPQVSPYFKIVTLSPGLDTNDHIGQPRCIRLYSSEPRRWRWGFRYQIEGSQRPMRRDQHHAYWKGRLYSLFSADLFNCFRESGKVVRFSFIEGEGHEGKLESQPIEFPAGTNKPKGVCIARWRDKLCLAGYDLIQNNDEDQLRVRVWSLSTADQSVWVMEHDRILSCRLLGGQGKPQIVGFHPFLGAVLILRGNTVHSFEVMKDEVCPIWYGPREVGIVSVYPFTPCLMDSLEHRNG